MSVELRITSLEAQMKNLQAALRKCLVTSENNILTGHLQLAGDPVGDLEPATKHYVDVSMYSPLANVTVVLAKLTPGGTVGSMAVSQGRILAYTPPS